MRLTTREITSVAIFTAALASTSWITIPLGSIAPITLQTIFVMLAGLVLGSRLGTISIVAYIILGAIGLPVFAGFKGGIGILFGPTGGFIFSFIIAVYFIGKMKIIIFINNSIWYICVILIVANLLIYMIGGTYIKLYLNINLASTLAILYPYIIGDLIKIMVSLYVYTSIRTYLTYEGSQI